jgi:hypothetical protein
MSFSGCAIVFLSDNWGTKPGQWGTGIKVVEGGKRGLGNFETDEQAWKMCQ